MVCGVVPAGRRRASGGERCAGAGRRHVPGQHRRQGHGARGVLRAMVRAWNRDQEGERDRKMNFRNLPFLPPLQVWPLQATGSGVREGRNGSNQGRSARPAGQGGLPSQLRPLRQVWRVWVPDPEDIPRGRVQCGLQWAS